MSTIHRINRYHLCLGCGLCQSYFGKDVCELQLKDGFYIPTLKSPSFNDEVLKELCPAIHIKSDVGKGVWGDCREVVESWSTDKCIRHAASSGGVVSSLAIFLLEQGYVDAVLQVGVCDFDYLHNELRVSRSREEVLRCAASRYAPCPTLQDIVQILEKDTSVYLLIGKPCDIAGARNLLNSRLEFKDRIRLFISIFCAGIPSFDATVKAWKLSGRTEPPQTLRYRGDGWPGLFRATWPDGVDYTMTYNESWGKILGKNISFRCKICPDGIGLLADIAVGDAWHTKDGYPDFTEAEGRSFVFIRSELGKDVMKLAAEKGYLECVKLAPTEIRQMQSYQYNRRHLVGWRIAAVQVFSGGILRFKGLGIMRLSLHANIKNGLRNMMGTFKRIAKTVWGGVKRFKSNTYLLYTFLQDFNVYRQATSDKYKKDNLIRQMMLLTHALEKGMSFPHKRQGWGGEKAHHLCDMVKEHLSKYGLSEECLSAICVLNTYLRDKDACKETDVTFSIKKMIDQYQENLIQGRAGVKEVKRPKPFDKSEILRFFESRHSVRTFSGEPITERELDLALSVARLTPTACNRQSSRIYTISDKNLMRQVLSAQLGDQGWCMGAAALYIITGEMTLFGNLYERQQVYIDGGLFAMNFVYGLHLAGLASCFKMFVREPQLQRKVRQICGIPANETPIVLILAGHYACHDSFSPVSWRIDYGPVHVS